MDTQGFRLLQRVASCLQPRLGRRTVLHAGRLVLIAGALLASVPREAIAQPLKLEFYELECRNESGRNRLGHDEVYVVMYAADISPMSLPPLRGIVRMTDVFRGVDRGEIRSQRVALWGLDGRAAEILDPPMHPNVEDLIVLVSLMEYDSSSDPNWELRLQWFLNGRLNDYRSRRLDPGEIARRLRDDMHTYLGLGPLPYETPKGDAIGRPQELLLRTEEVIAARHGWKAVTMELEHRGLHARYLTRFELRRP